MRARTVLAVLLAGLLLSACWAVPQSVSPVKGSGHSINEWREVKGITSVNLGTIGELTISLGSEESLRVQGEDNILPYIVTQVAGGELRIEIKPNTNISPTMPVRYDLTVKELESVQNGSVGTIVVTDPGLNADRFTISVNSTGDVTLVGLRANSLEVHVFSVGDVDIINGLITYQKVILSSTGSYTADSVRSKDAVVEINSTGSATLWVDETLDVTINSTGNVSYYGSPKVTSKLTSVGKVIPLREK